MVLLIINMGLDVKLIWDRLEGQNEMVRQSRFVIMRMYNNFHLTFSKNQNIIKNERVANERKSSFCCSFLYFTIIKCH